MLTQLELPFYEARPPGSPAPVDLRCSGLRLEEPLGAGALGVTWRSRLPEGTPVAAKLLTAGPGPLRRLDRIREVGLGGPNVLEVVSAFEEDGRVWVTSRMHDGVPLSQLLERDGIRSVHAVAIGLDVLGALAFLHARDVWHGAVHARNVHVGRDGTVRVGDYGLTDEPAGRTATDLRASDVHAAAALIASMLGSGRRSSGSLTLALKAISGSRRLLPAGHEAAHAHLTLREGAHRLATPGKLRLARDQLAEMVARVSS